MKFIKEGDKPDALGALVAEAQGMESESAAPGEGEPAPEPEVSNADALFFMLGMARDLGCSVFEVQSPKKTLNDDALRAIADPWGKVADKYGFKLSDAGGAYKLELQAVITTALVLQVAHKALRAELKAKDAARTVDMPPPPPPPATATTDDDTIGH